jgi:hypothetical protein
MSKALNTTITLILAITNSCLFAQNQSKSSSGIIKLTASMGYQQENFNWSIAGNTDGQNPNVYSELKWRKLQVPVMQLSIDVKPWKNLIIKTAFNYGIITSGSVNDRDYVGDDRTRNVYDGTFKSNEGSTRSAEILIGYTLLSQKKVPITPLLGYGLYRQELYLLGSDSNTNEKLRSTYKTFWNGLVVGIESVYKVHRKLNIEPAIFYNQLTYKSEADWNLIQKFKHPISFKQHANAFKVEARTNIRYKLNSHISFLVYGCYSYWKTGIGVDRLYLNDGTVSDTQFNGAHRKGISCGAGISWSVFQTKFK